MLDEFLQEEEEKRKKGFLRRIFGKIGAPDEAGKGPEGN